MNIAPIPFSQLMASIQSATYANTANNPAANAPAFAKETSDEAGVVREGGRNNEIARVAGRSLSRGNSEEETITLALAANRKFAPPLGDDEVITTCQSINRTHARNTIGGASATHPDALSPLFSIADYKASRFFNRDPKPRRWLIQSLIPAGILASLVAPGGTGKSNFAMQLGVTIATGFPLADHWQGGETGPVLMLLGEDDEDELHRRVQNITQQLVMNGDYGAVKALGDNLIIKSVIGENNLLTATNPNSREVELTVRLQQLVVTAKQIPELKLVVLDPASRFRGGDENAAQDVTRFVEACEQIAQQTGATVLVIHHTNKAAMSSSEHSQAASRGSSALTDGVRLQLNLGGIDAKTAKKYGIDDGERKQFLTLAVTKTNYSPPQEDVLLQRGELGYLHAARRTTHQANERGDLGERIIALVAQEQGENRRHTKSGFVKAFGGLRNTLKAGDNRVRAVVTGLLAKGKLKLDAKKKLSSVPRGKV